MIIYTGTVMVRLLIELTCDVLQCQRVSCLSPGDVVSEVKSFVKNVFCPVSS